MGKTREAGELLSNNLLTADSSAETVSVGTAITFFGGNTGIVSANSFHSSGASTFTGDVNIGTGATTAFFDVSNGRIGIGTTNPTAKLDVNGDVSIASTVSIGTTIDIIPYNDLGALSFEGSAGQLFSITNDLTSGSIFSVNDVSGIPSIDVDADGTIQLAPYGSTEYVGIGTTNPTKKLHVEGNALVNGNLYLNDTNYLSSLPTGDYGSVQINGSGKGNWQGYSINGHAVFMSNGPNSSFGLFDDTNNHWAILHSRGGNSYTEIRGGNNSTNLSVYGTDVRVQNVPLIGGGRTTLTGTASQNLQFDGGAYFSGDVGIGTTNPTAKLDVRGNLNVSGVSTFSGDVSFGSTATFGDNDKLKFGDSDDLQIYHDGNQSYISDQGSGSLRLLSNQLRIRSDQDDAELAKFLAGGGVQLYYDNSKKFETTGVGVSIVNGTSDTATIYGPSNLIIDPMPIGVGTTSGVVRIKGDLFVDGTTTQINSTTLEIADFIVGVATTATSDLLTDGAGIGIGSDKTFLYEHNGGTIPSLKSSENLNVASGKAYQIDQTEVLNATTLGSGVTNSSLTSVGTLTELRVHDGNVIFQDNILYFDNTTFSTFDWQYYQADNGKLLWTVTGTGGPEMEIEGDGADRTNTILRVGGYTVWNAGNDGTGSGLDADTLDGQEGSYYLDTSATSQTKLGNLTVGTATTGVAIRTDGTLNVTGVSTFTGDVNIGTGATTAFFDVSSGFVGIGTANPDFPLHVFNSVQNNIALFESGDAFAEFGLSDINGSVSFLTTLGNLKIKTGGDAGTAGTNSIDALFIASTGEVGIGTDSPGAKLDVDGDIYVGDKIASRQFPSLSFLDLDDDNNPGVLGQTGNNYVTLASASGLNLIFDTNNNDNHGLVIGSGNNTTTNTTKHMVISGVGSVGIGTTTPTQRLHVEGDTLVNGNLYLNDTNYLSSLPTGDFGSVQINGSGKGNWKGYSIDGGAVFMFNGNTSFGLYDDTNNHWAIRHFIGGSSYTELYGGNNSVNLSVYGTDVRVENVPLIVNTTTLTGTASQNLQVTGGAYVSGDVGIGNTNPEKPLHVKTSVATPVIVERTAANNTAIEYRNSTSSMWAGIGGNAEGWGVANAADVGSDAYILVTRTGGELLINSTSSTGTASQKLQVTGGAYFSGDVGIGVTNPGSTLAVGGTITELYDDSYWNVVTQADVGYGASQVPLNQYLGQLAFLDDYHPNGLRRDGGGSDDVFVNSSGLVGIGTDSPSVKLDVVGDANISGVVTATSFHGDGSKLTTNYAKFIGIGTADVNSSTSYSEVSWLNTTPQFSNGTWSATSSHIVVPSTGLYLVQVNLYLIGLSGQRSNVGLKFAVNDVQQSEIAAHDYIRFASGHNEASINMSTTLSLSADDEVSIYTVRLATAGVVELQGTNSTISLTQLA